MTLPVSPHSEDIKAAIRKKGETLYSLARKNGLSKHAISVSLITPLPAAHRAVAAFLGVPVHELWPDWYDESGKRITKRSPLKTSPKAHASHSKKGARRLSGGKAAAR